jgi:hypothetical protein
MRTSVMKCLLLLGVAAYAWSAEETVVDFENAVPLLADHKANRVSRWEEKGVVFTLARDPQQTKGRGLPDSGEGYLSKACLFCFRFLLGGDGDACPAGSL